MKLLYLLNKNKGQIMKAVMAELKGKASEFSIDALKKECLCIVGLYARANKTPETKDVEPKEIKFSIESTAIDAEDEPYGGLMKKYLGR